MTGDVGHGCEVKSMTFNYPEFCVLLSAVIAQRDYDQSFLMSAALHPSWFDASTVEAVLSRAQHVSALLRKLGVEE